MELTTPAIVGLQRKSRREPDARRSIELALRAARGVPQPVPVLHERCVIGHAFGLGYDDPRTLFIPLKEKVPLWRWHMGYVSYDQIINANTAGRRGTQPWSKNNSTATLSNNWYDLWPVAGLPAAGTYSGSALSARNLTDGDTGAIYKFGNVASTYTMHLLTQWASSTAGTPMLLLYDRVLTYEACITTTTSAVSLTNTNTAARYNGSGLSGMQMVLCSQTAIGSTATTLSALSYTNQAGTSGEAMPTTRGVGLIASAAAPTSTLGARVIAPADAAATFAWSWALPLATGDGGVRAVASYTLQAVSSGTVTLILARPLAYVPLPTAGVATMIDMVQQIAGLERVYDGACLSFLAMTPTATSPAFQGSIDFGWN